MQVSERQLLHTLKAGTLPDGIVPLEPGTFVAETEHIRSAIPTPILICLVRLAEQKGASL